MTGYRPARQLTPINPHRAEGRMVKASGIGAKGFIEMIAMVALSIACSAVTGSLVSGWWG